MDPLLHPGRSGLARANDRVVLRLGQLHPAVSARWELPRETFVAFIDLAYLRERELPIDGSLPSKYPAASRDLSIAVDERVPWATVRDAVRAAAGKHLAGLALLDVYRGPQAGEGKKSFAMRLSLRSEEATLTEDEIQRLLRRVGGRLQHEVGATIRE